MYCYQIWSLIAASVSSFFSGCIVYYTCRQARIQKDNYKLSLFKERFRTIESILSAYSYFEGEIDRFIRAYIFENNDSEIPIRGYGIKRELQDSSDSFRALFPDKRKDFAQYAEDYDNLLGKARVMCQNITLRQSGNDVMTLITFYSGRSGQERIRKEELIEVFPQAKSYIDDFCNKQSEFINRYSSFISYLKDKVVIK